MTSDSFNLSDEASGKAEEFTVQKQTFGESILEGLSEFADALAKGEPLTKRFTCRRIELNLDQTPFKAESVKQTREILKASQAVFAQFLGVSTKTVQAWESGHNIPSDMARRFLDEIRGDPAYWRKRLKAVVITKGTRGKKLAKAR